MENEKIVEELKKSLNKLISFWDGVGDALNLAMNGAVRFEIENIHYLLDNSEEKQNNIFLSLFIDTIFSFVGGLVIKKAVLGIFKSQAAISSLLHHSRDEETIGELTQGKLSKAIEAILTKKETQSNELNLKRNLSGLLEEFGNGSLSIVSDKVKEQLEINDGSQKAHPPSYLVEKFIQKTQKFIRDKREEIREGLILCDNEDYIPYIEKVVKELQKERAIFMPESDSFFEELKKFFKANLIVLYHGDIFEYFRTDIYRGGHRPGDPIRSTISAADYYSQTPGKYRNYYRNEDIVAEKSTFKIQPKGDKNLRQVSGQSILDLAKEFPHKGYMKWKYNKSFYNQLTYLTKRKKFEAERLIFEEMDKYFKYLFNQIVYIPYVRAFLGTVSPIVKPITQAGYNAVKPLGGPFK